MNLFQTIAEELARQRLTSAEACGLPPTLQAERYLRALARLAPGGTLLDVRYRTRTPGFARFFIPIHARGSAALIARLGSRTDIYVGVAPRRRRSGGRDDVAPTALLWADCDSREASEALYGFVPEATMVVASGSPSRVHGYWALNESLGVPALESLNRRLALALGADAGAVTNAAAILRVPGTRSFKHSPPRPVALLCIRSERHAPAQIDAALPPLPQPPAVKRRSAGRGSRDENDPLRAIAPPEYVRVLTGHEVGRDGKIRCPFHEDRTPSLHVYPTPERGWTCFACTAPNGKALGGDIYTLASLLWLTGQSRYGPLRGRQFIELRQRLMAIFFGDGADA
jgi:CHC2 zinc finger